MCRRLPASRALNSADCGPAPHALTGRPEAAAPRSRRRRGRAILRTAVSAALVAAAFGFALPRVASYRSVWASVHGMTWPHALLVAIAAAASMSSYWIAIRAVLPALRLRQAAVVSLGSNAVANTLPAGGALAMGVSWAMLSSWGLSTADYVLYTLVSGVWNVFALLGLPVLALLVMTTAGRPDAGLIAAAAVGLVLLAAMATGLGLLLRSRAFAQRAGRAVQRPVAFAARLARRPPPASPAGSLSSFRHRAGALLAARGWRITVATVASNLALWLVLLACLRGLGLSQTQVSWQASLGAFAFIRLLTALPITPGGLGITELGLVGILAVGAGHAVSVQVTAAVLLYRALTYLPPIPLGALACLVWRHAPTLVATRPGTVAEAQPASAGTTGELRLEQSFARRAEKRYPRRMDVEQATAVRTRHWHRPGKRAVVVTDLAHLQGPASGTVVLPHWLYWSPAGHTWDLDDPEQTRSLYEHVLSNVVEASDLTSYLNAATLTAIWPRLWLPRGLRAAWEEYHPQLRAVAAV